MQRLLLALLAILLCICSGAAETGNLAPVHVLTWEFLAAHIPNVTIFVMERNETFRTDNGGHFVGMFPVGSNLTFVAPETDEFEKTMAAPFSKTWSAQQHYRR